MIRRSFIERVATLTLAFQAAFSDVGMASRYENAIVPILYAQAASPKVDDVKDVPAPVPTDVPIVPTNNSLESSGNSSMSTKEELPPKSESNLSPVVKEMQIVEPGFLPKDDRAVQLFMLQRVIAANDDALKKKLEQAGTRRSALTLKFREDLRRQVGNWVDQIDEKQAAALNEAIAKYEHALRHNPNHPSFAADARYFLGLYYFKQDEKDYFDKLARYNDAREKGLEDVPYPEEDFHRTIDLYENLLKRYPKYRHADSVHYLLAVALWYEGAFYNSVDKFQELIAKYPKSRYVEEVWFRLGEYFYDMNDYDAAIAAYQRVANNPSSPLHDKAIYKIAWSQYQKDRFMLAIKDFIKVLEITYNETGEGAAAGMRSEVIRYIVKSFSEQLLMDVSGKVKPPKPKAISRTRTTPQKVVEPTTKKPKLEKGEKDFAEKMGNRLAERVIKYFEDAGLPAYTRDILIELASQLLDESKIEGAVRAFDRLIALDPNHQDNPRFASQIVDILQEDDRFLLARERNQALIEAYGKDSAWFKAQEDNYLAQSFAREAVRDAILALAVYYHKTAKEQKDAKNVSGSQANFRRAADLYATYLREYPERDDTYKAIFYLAETAYELNRFRYALDAYQLLKDYPLPLPEGTRRDATFNIVFTFRHVLESEAKEKRFKEIDFDGLTSKARGLVQEEIPELGKKYLASIEEFLKIAPNDSQVPILLFHAAAIYYVYGHSDEAQSRFYFIIDTYPKTTAAAVAARLIIDDAVSKEEWARVVALSQRFKDLDLGGMKGDFARIEGNAKFKIARAIFEQANELQKNKQLTEAKAKFKESAELFAALLAEDPQNPYADIMLFNSARAVTMSGTTTAALPLYRKLYTQYPNSEYAKLARFQEALALEKMLKFSEAARAYDGIVKQDPKSESAGDAMLNKALLYEAAGESANATLAFVEFAKRYPNRVEAPDAYLAAANIYRKMGKTNQQIAMLEQFIKQYRNDGTKTPAVIEAHVQIADTYGDLESKSTSPSLKKSYDKFRRDHYRSAVSLYRQNLNSQLAAFFAAKAQLALDKAEQEAFKTRSINARVGKAQGEQLTAMMKELSALSQRNEAIIRTYAQPTWNAEAMRRIGALYEHLAKSMIKAPCPKDVAVIDEFACDEYTVLLEDKAAVLEGKSLDAYRQAYEIAMSAYDAPADLVTNILAGLSRLRPGEYQRVGTLIEKPRMGALYGEGRMLSTGKNSSSLHPLEIDPDKAKKAVEPLQSDQPTLPNKEEENSPPVPPVEEDLPQQEEGVVE